MPTTNDEKIRKHSMSKSPHLDYKPTLKIQSAAVNTFSIEMSNSLIHKNNRRRYYQSAIAWPHGRVRDSQLNKLEINARFSIRQKTAKNNFELLTFSLKANLICSHSNQKLCRSVLALSKKC